MKYKMLICSILFLLNNTYSIMQVQLPNNDTVVTYEPSSDHLQRYYLDLTVIGNGRVYDGTVPIEEGSVTYEMIYTDSKTFALKPKKNSYLKKVIVDGVSLDISKTMTINISHMRKDMKIVVEFADQSQNKETEQPLPENPVDDNKENPPEFEKEVIIIITQDIPLEDVPEKITDEFIRKYLDINDDYKILSHNIRNQSGTYEVMIQFSDGSIHKVKIEVVGPKQKEETKKEVVSEECRIHILMLILLLIYVSCNIVMSIKTVSKINKLKQRQRKEGNDET